MGNNSSGSRRATHACMGMCQAEGAPGTDTLHRAARQLQESIPLHTLMVSEIGAFIIKYHLRKREQESKVIVKEQNELSNC